MNSYDIVKNAIEFNNPERLPCEFGAMGLSDTYRVNWNQIGIGDKTKRETYDEWGCLWARTEQANMGQVKGHPLSDWGLIDKFKWPDPDNKEFYKGMERKFNGSEGKYIITEIFMLLFERLHSIRGFENTLMDLYLERENIDNLADRIVEYDIAIIENISVRFPGQIHALRFTDDWGTELSTFISPQLWSEFFKPKYKRIFDAAKKAGWHVWMHSCGKINDIVDDLIDAGVDVLNLQQPRILGIEEFGKRFAGKVCFSTLCDIQRTLPFKGKNEIEEEAKLLIDCWGTEKGGLILSDYGDGGAIGVPISKKQIMFEAFMKNDRWKKRQD
jgi:hypothetical protein